MAQGCTQNAVLARPISGLCVYRVPGITCCAPENYWDAGRDDVLRLRPLPGGPPYACGGEGSVLSEAELDALIDQATVDCYNDDEELAGFAVMLEDNLALPFETTALGVT